MAEVPSDVRARLQAGSCETVNLMEWLAADMAALAKSIAAAVESPALSRALLDAAEQMPGVGVTKRLRAAGAAIAGSVGACGRQFEALADHPSDLVRQWACYAANDGGVRLSLEERLDGTLRFAADRNMSVREAAWMAFRPHLASDLERGLGLLTPLSRHANDNIRRFAVEVTRPRSVWGAHIAELKRRPGLALSLLEPVRADESRYVKLAVGNWLNDASKTRPDWVQDICARWGKDPNPHTAMIVRRGLRSVSRNKVNASPLL